jgi:hypothetical protein
LLDLHFFNPLENHILQSNPPFFVAFWRLQSLFHWVSFHFIPNISQRRIATDRPNRPSKTSMVETRHAPGRRKSAYFCDPVTAVICCERLSAKRLNNAK